LLLAMVLRCKWSTWNGLLAKVLGIWWPTWDGDSSKQLKNKQKKMTGSYKYLKISSMDVIQNGISKTISMVAMQIYIDVMPIEIKY
jgi:hypothetical protein